MTFQSPLFKLPENRDLDSLHEVSSVKVPRPASPFITHETIVTNGDGGCCISWHWEIEEKVYLYRLRIVVI
jgi:hypothetical protein